MSFLPRGAALWAAAAFLLPAGCNRLPTPPADPVAPQAAPHAITLVDSIIVALDTVRDGSGDVLRVDTTYFTDTLIVSSRRDLARGFIRDDDGVWYDLETSYFDTVWSPGPPPRLGVKWSYGPPFVDMPAAYRQFWRYCGNCHSSMGKSALAPEGRQALKLNNWEEIKGYGPAKLLLAARGGGMPVSPAPPVPDDVLGRAQAYLASWGERDPAILLVDYRWKDAEEFVRKYCADCHAPGGTHPKQPRAAIFLLLDTYGQWQKHQKGIRERLAIKFDSTLDSFSINMRIMPPPPDPARNEPQPTDDERRKFMEWIDRFSPNTPDGSGKGDSVRGGHIVTEGAVAGLRYPEAFRFFNRYCADCHTAGGLNKVQPDAWTFSLRLDTYQESHWRDRLAEILIERMDPVVAAQHRLDVMPPVDFPLQPLSAELNPVLEWLRRGAPNTPDGR